MAKPTGFLEYARQFPIKQSVERRLRHWEEMIEPLPEAELEKQAARCMDCGIPYCHSFGCPVYNRIPDWNDAVYRQRWPEALELLHSTNNLPEITGRVCPAPCEAACTLSINEDPVTICNIELQIVERGFAEGWIKPQPAPVKSGQRVAVVGSGPAGLAAAQQLARLGHEVVVFEKSDRIGGLLRYGIPDFKLEKRIIDRRLEQMRAEGVFFEVGVEAGVDISLRYMRRAFGAIVICTGAGVPRDLELPGRDLDGIHFALDFLSQQNRRVAGDAIDDDRAITAADKKVVVIGGGDTGSDCLGTSLRQGASSLVQIELLPKPPDIRTAHNPWPTWPQTLRTSSSQEEGGQRLWSILTKQIDGRQGRVTKLHCVKLDWSDPDANGRRDFTEIPGSEFELEADLVLLAMGFTHTQHGPLVADLALDQRGNLEVNDNLMASMPGVFAAGDSVSGASLVVSVIQMGRRVADCVQQYLTTLK